MTTIVVRTAVYTLIPALDQKPVSRSVKEARLRQLFQNRPHEAGRRHMSIVPPLPGSGWVIDDYGIGQLRLSAEPVETGRLHRFVTLSSCIRNRHALSVASGPWVQGQTMQNIVVLLNMDDVSSRCRTLPLAINHARHAKARLHVLGVVPDDMFKMTIVAQPITKACKRVLIGDATQRLNTLVETYATSDVELEQAVHFGSVHKEALRHARNTEADLIIVGTAVPELKDYVVSSSAARIVQRATSSVWVVRE